MSGEPFQHIREVAIPAHKRALPLCLAVYPSRPSALVAALRRILFDLAVISLAGCALFGWLACTHTGA